MKTKQAGKLFIVATPIGNLADLSARAQATLSNVDWIAAEDTRHSQLLLNHIGIHTPLISYYEHNAQHRTTELIERLASGQTGALISDAGTPLINDPGYLLVSQAHQHDIEVIAIPGPCAPIAALSISGLPTDKFLFEGFLNAKSTARKSRLLELIDFPHTIIFLESVHRIKDVIQECAQILGGQRRAALARELTKKFESLYSSTLSELELMIHEEKIPLKGEFVLMIEGNNISLSKDESEMQRIMKALLSELSLKQSIQLALKLTSFSKNALYDCAMKLQNDSKK